MTEKVKHKRTIELRSEEIEDLLGRPPKRIIRYGITAVFVVFAILFTGSWFVKYPDVIPSNIEVTSQNPPAYIASRVNGKIEKIFVNDKQRVDSGRYLAIIDNPASYQDVFSVKNMLTHYDDFLQTYNMHVIDTVALRKPRVLGELQSEYSTLLTSIEDYFHFLNLDYYDKKIESLNQELSMFNMYYDRLYSQKMILEEDMSLSKKDFERVQKLYSNDVVTDVDLERSKSDYLKKELAFQEARTNLANTKIQISKLEQEILDFQLQKKQDKKDLQLAVAGAIKDLFGKIEVWEKDYVLKAPVSGIITFNKYWVENQNVEEGDKVFAVVPDSDSDMVGKVQLKTRGAGKVRPGQQVNIKFNNYPYMEFGMVKGVVKDISLVPSDEDFYLVEVSFPEGMKTNYGQILDFSQKMLGQAEIITEEIPLIIRIIRPIRSLIKNRSFKKLPEEEPEK